MSDNRELSKCQIGITELQEDIVVDDESYNYTII